MGNVEFLLTLIQVLEQFELKHTEAHKFLMRVGYYHSREGEITPEQMKEVYKISDRFFMYICSSGRIPLKDVKYFYEEE